MSEHPLQTSMAPPGSHIRHRRVRAHPSKEARAQRAKTDAPAEETTPANSVSGAVERWRKRKKIN
jgi:hypothetical protein